MSDSEKEILKRIKDNPFISQRELAEAIGLSRPSVANIISGLIQKEYVMGKAYVLNEDYPIVCIGAANVDRKFYVHKDLVAETSNPVTSTRSIGGVARNIAENLGRLGETVAFLSASGQDSEWEMIKRLSTPFMNLDHVQQFENASTGSYTALISKEGDMTYGLADMEVFDYITPEFLIKRSHLLKKAKCIIVDLNLGKEALNFLCAYTTKHQIKLVITTVSSPKMKNMPDSLHAIDWIITNKDETETYLNLKIESTDDLKIAAKRWNDLGVKNVIVTNGVKELIYRSGEEEIIKSVMPSNSVKDVTGAGDSFCAAVVYSWLNGMPYPQNVEMVTTVEQIIRNNGAIPATIAIIDGKIKIGLESEDLEILATSKDVAKVSRRDLAEVVAMKRIGATTVATTMICAAMAGIQFFVTGGIGGVHKGAEHTMDISADLEELSKTNVTVICAGAKSILDLPKTMEYLETKGVPVIGYQTNELPAFFTRESGVKLTSSVETPERLADIHLTKQQLNLEGGIVVANPIPYEHALSKAYIEAIINEAVVEAENQGIKGKDATPFLLGKIVEKTNGKSLAANIKLVENNAVLGAKIAVAVNKLL